MGTFAVFVFCSCGKDDGVSESVLRNWEGECDDGNYKRYDENGHLVYERIPSYDYVRWYEYNEKGIKVFGAGCTIGIKMCHHYYGKYNSRNHLEVISYSNEYVCEDLGDVYRMRTFSCEEASPVAPSYRLILYWKKDDLLGYDSIPIDFFNANTRFE